MTKELSGIEPKGTELRDADMHRGRLLTLGVLAIVAGIAAILLPQVAAFTVELVLGVLLVLDGVCQGIQAFELGQRRGFGWKLFSAIVALGVGVILLVFPLSGVLTLGLLIGAFFVASGVLRMLLAYRLRGLVGSGWLLFVGVLSVVVGGSILVWWPHAAAWLVGVLVGVDLMLGGAWLITLALASRPLNGPYGRIGI